MTPDSVDPIGDPLPAADPQTRRKQARGLNIAIGVGIVLLGAGLWLVTLVPGWLSREPGASVSAPAPEAPSVRRIQATLFYVSDDGAQLVPSTREVLYGSTPAEQARQIVMAQVSAPPQGQVSAIPAGTAVHGVFMGSKGELYVDLTPDVLHHPGGSLDETLAVYAIVNAVTSSLPGVTAVQILIDGKEVDSLAGHIDLREPIGRSDAWVRKGQ
jgi:hypothetical protein